MSLTTAMRRWSLALLLPVAAVLGGCAHPIAMAPQLDAITAPAGSTPIDKKVGLLITEADRSLQVETPGGGGDKITYFPYKDLETGLYVALTKSFAGVSRVSSPTDPKIAAEGLSLVVTPRMTTTSFSDSVLTWPPTLFTIELVCKVTSSTGQPVTELRVMGEGRASFDEFKGNPGLSAQRAAEDALKKLVQVLGSTPALR